MHFVLVKEEQQQVILCLHHTRQGFVAEHTVTYNWLRGLISEFGIVLPQKVSCIEDLLAHAGQLDLRLPTTTKSLTRRRAKLRAACA